MRGRRRAAPVPVGADAFCTICKREVLATADLRCPGCGCEVDPRSLAHPPREAPIGRITPLPATLAGRVRSKLADRLRESLTPASAAHPLAPMVVERAAERVALDEAYGARSGEAGFMPDVKCVDCRGLEGEPSSSWRCLLHFARFCREREAAGEAPNQAWLDARKAGGELAAADLGEEDGACDGS